MNTGFYKDLDEIFEIALKMSERDFSHEELIKLLETGNIPQKQIAALKLKNLTSQKDAQILLNNLTGCDGKIREAVALKINRFIYENSDYLIWFSNAELFANATIDINANICRLVLSSVEKLKLSENFSKIYLDKILVFINEAFEELDNFIFRDKKYVINKQLFKLYWCLEALKLFANDVDEDLMYKILTRASKEKEYTIREKVAQILVCITQPTEKYHSLISELKNDENYYVRCAFN